MWFGYYVAFQIGIAARSYWTGASLTAGLFMGLLTKYVLQRKTLNDRCRILFFRSFDDRTGRDANRAVLPVLGMFGDLITVTSKSLERARTLPVLFSSKVISDVDNHIELSDDEWPDRVKEEILRSDIVVADLSMPKDNVVWEISQALAYLPHYRVLFVCAVDRDPTPVLDTIDELLKDHGSDLAD